MDTYKIIIQILVIVLLIVGIANRKKPWGQKLILFTLGMLVMLVLTDGVEGLFKGMAEMAN